MNSTAASPLIGAVNCRPARIGLRSGAWTACAKAVPAKRPRLKIVARLTKRARNILPPRTDGPRGRPDGARLYSHFAVPILRFRVNRPEDLHMPFSATPGLDHLGGDDIDQDLGEQPAFGVALEVVRRIVPREIRIEHQREKQVVA